MLGQGAQEAEEGGCCGEGRKAEKGQAGRGYFNLINDRTPLRVCFNNQDTLQQVDRMFAVNLHMSSEQAVSINNVREHNALQPLLEPAGCSPVPGWAFLSPGVWGQWPEKDRSEGYFGWGISILGSSQVSPPK